MQSEGALTGVSLFSWHERGAATYPRRDIRPDGGNRQLDSVPSPDSLQSSRRPPISSVRSRMPDKPKCPAPLLPRAPRGRCPCRHPARAPETASRHSGFPLRSARRTRVETRCGPPRWRFGTRHPSPPDAESEVCLRPRHRLPSASPSCHSPGCLRALCRGCRWRRPNRLRRRWKSANSAPASRPSVMACAACSIALSNSCFATSGLSGRLMVAALKRSKSPWKLCSRVSCSSRAIRVRSLTRASSPVLNCHSS